MSETIEHDYTTAAGLKAACRDLIRPLGHRATATCLVGNNYSSTATVLISFGPLSENIWGQSWDDVFADARKWVSGRAAVARNTTIRRMALAIIETTDEHGKCTVPLLSAKGFDAEEIREFHATACERAGEMAQGAPFSVEGV